MPRVILPPLPLDPTQEELPNLDGFREAQDRLRRVMGTDVIFRVPVDPVWPAGTRLDPQTQRPYDPTVQPQSGGGYTTVTKRVMVVFRPIRTNVEDPLGDDERGGLRHGESIALGIGEDDHPDVQGATRATVRGVEYKITSMIPDTSPDPRYIAFLEAR